MAKPDDDHTCQPILDEAGQPIAVVHGSPDMSDEARRALTNLVEAARRQFAMDDADGQISAGQAASRERIQERRRRLLGDG